MKRVDVVLLYEKAVRELDVACILKYLAQRDYGLNVEIVQQNYGYAEAFRTLRPRVVILPYCYQARSNNPVFLKWRHAVYFNLTWEQLLYPGNQKAKTPRGEFAVCHVLHHAWTDTYADLLRAKGVPAEHIFLNGNPAYALYEQPYARYFQTRAELAALHSLEAERRWVFFPENYNWAFYGEAMLQQMIRDGQSPDDVYGMKAFTQKSFEAVIRWCETAAQLCNVEIILRPRPSTAQADLDARAREIVPALPKHLHIIQDESVREWVLASDMVVSSYSTTLIEAAVAGKPGYMLEPFELLPALRQEWHKLIAHAATEQEFLKICGDAPDVQSSTRLGAWARMALMSRGDTIRNLVDYVARICRGEIPRPGVAPAHSLTLPSARPVPWWVAYWRRRIPLMLTTPKVRSEIEPDRLPDVLAFQEIDARIDRWAHVLNGAG